MKSSLIVGLAIVLIGCESSWQSAPLTAEQASVIATRLANEKASAVYHCQPFQNSELPRSEAGHWIWSEQRGFGTGDIQASVELAADGSTNSVSIQLYDSKAPPSRVQ
jgi:hypothetical protein